MGRVRIKTPDGCKGGWTCAKHAPGGREAVGRLRVNYRYYNPTDGRWTRRDPIGVEGGYNLYTYCKNIPVLLADRLGKVIPYVGGVAGGGASYGDVPNTFEQMGKTQEEASDYLCNLTGRNWVEATEMGAELIRRLAWPCLNETNDEPGKQACIECCDTANKVHLFLSLIMATKGVSSKAATMLSRMLALVGVGGSTAIRSFSYRSCVEGCECQKNDKSNFWL